MVVDGPDQLFWRGRDVFLWGDIVEDGHYHWSWGAESCHHRTVAAVLRTRVIGVFRFEIDKGELMPRGTWVHHDFRRRGIARKMWRRVMRAEPVRKIDVLVVTDLGLTLAKSFMRTCQVDVTEDGVRDLRDLRKESS